MVAHHCYLHFFQELGFEIRLQVERVWRSIQLQPQILVDLMVCLCTGIRYYLHQEIGWVLLVINSYLKRILSEDLHPKDEVVIRTPRNLLCWYITATKESLLLFD